MASHYRIYQFYGLLFSVLAVILTQHTTLATSLSALPSPRQRISINSNWRFQRFPTNPDGLIYDIRPDTPNNSQILKPWILPSGNSFILDPANRHVRPAGNPGGNLSFARGDLKEEDGEWEMLDLPHDWAIKGPFYTSDSDPVTGNMGRLPIQGVGWYRKKLTMMQEDFGKSIYLEIDGAMSYAMVWLNGHLVGGWPYGYASFRLDLSPYLKVGEDNQLAIRLDNPVNSSRWYPGAGLYRNVWLTKVEKVHVGQWGTSVTTREVSNVSATVDLVVKVENDGVCDKNIQVITDVYEIDDGSGKRGDKVTSFEGVEVVVKGGEMGAVNGSVVVERPKLWGPLASNQKPNMYVAVTSLYSRNTLIDTYETPFGIRSVVYDPNHGLIINNEPVRIQGTNLHHDFGALGSAFNYRAAQRRLEIQRDLGSNAIRMSHNPPAPELLDLCDEMGFLVLDEIFDVWEVEKVAADFHLIFDDWHEPDLRAFIRRDRNHPSVVFWSFGNEVGEQYLNQTGADLATKLHDITFEEDPTRRSTASMNYAKPYMPFPRALDLIALNYQGEGIRDGGAYAGLSGIVTQPLYGAFHETFPEKMIFSSETSSGLSTRGTLIFPVTPYNSAPVNDTSGGNSTSFQVSAYELYSANFGASADKVFAAQDNNTFVAGEFVWSGWDYLGEPTPYDVRSSYSGIVDLAGLPKERYYIYQARWRPDLPMAHILPHWTWPERVGLVTPVHVFTSGDEAELFVNGVSQGGRVKKGRFEYRFRWDEVVYQPGSLHVETYKNGVPWANATILTTSPAFALRLVADRSTISADGYDLAFLTVSVVDEHGETVPRAANEVTFELERKGEIVATDNGDPSSLVAFPEKTRKAFSGKAIAIVKGIGERGDVVVTARAEGLGSARVVVRMV